MKKFFPWVCALLILATAASPRPAGAGALPESAHVSGLTGHAQTYPLSCESRSAVDWAAYWGAAISEAEFLFALPVSDNPEVGFVGSVYGAWGAIPPHGYGVHARPVAALLRRYGLQAKARYGLKWNDLRAELAAGRPVIVWIIGAMWPGTPLEYTADDGRTVTVARYEHTMIVTGYDAAYVYATDASTGVSQGYPQRNFLNSWKVLGNMAVTGTGPDKPPAPAAAAPRAGGRPRGESYTVQPGDYLIALGQKFGTSWEELARLNAIPYPYTIYAGQVLALPGKPVTVTHQLYLPLMRRKASRSASP